MEPIQGWSWKSFLADKRNIFEHSWFNLHKNSEYSLGDIYLALLNLPRKERFKFENIIVGIIAGPRTKNNCK